MTTATEYQEIFEVVKNLEDQYSIWELKYFVELCG